MKTLVFVLAVLAAAGLAWVRFAPDDLAKWHVDPKGATPEKGHYVVKPSGGDADFAPVREAPEALLARLDEIVLATPCTIRLAGTPAEGRITYVTRSRLFGFPDYTTVSAVSGAEGTSLLIHARLRYGLDDLGVNRARVEGWLAALSP